MYCSRRITIKRAAKEREAHLREKQKTQKARNTTGDTSVNEE